MSDLIEDVEDVEHTVAVAPDGMSEVRAARTGGRRRPLRVALALLASLGVTAVAVAAATGAFGGSDAEGTESGAASGPAKTATVQRTDLTRGDTLDGTLGYGDSTPVQAAGQGVLTWLPSAGDTVKRGQPVYRLNEQKVPLLYGATPLYRTLDVDAEGRDVEVLEKNLAALGYTGFTVDDTYTEGTADAVRDWQKDLGRAETGTVGAGDAVVAPGARRVAEVQGTLGGQAGGTVLTWTGTVRTVTVELDVKDEDLVSGDDTRATVKLPDGRTVEAEVTEVGTAVTAAATASTGGQSSDPTLPVTLTVDDQRKLGRYQAAPVDVDFEAETRKNVLAVPVEALVALREGGYAVERVTATGSEYLAVDTGLFAGGMVEISGAGVTEGLKVGVPK
ncbi:peptidoglycan-binding protein [Streptomyces sp. NPDC002680]|uniref:peptidoglycan-binding protein n=1 Tax=Streptomyces sp. NPDC002680 TaxID=3364659 RepID=UPI0036A7F6FD